MRSKDLFFSSKHTCLFKDVDSAVSIEKEAAMLLYY